MKTEIIKVDETRYVCDYCGSTSKYPYMTEKCEINCKEKIPHDVCDHEFFFDVGADNDYDYMDISRKCKKCDFIANTKYISIYDIKNYLTEDIIKKMYEEN